MSGLSSFPARSWYSAGWSHEFAAGKPVTRRIVGRDIVFFRDRDGRLAALDAMCPHRGADLGLGKVVDGHIECPFHGWQFSREGRCMRVPSQCASTRIPPDAMTRAYRVEERQQIVWLWPDASSPGRLAPPSYPFLDPRHGRGMRRTQDIALRIAAPFAAVVENALDTSHLPFVHAGTLDGEPRLVAEQAVHVDADMRGFWGQRDPRAPVRDEAPGDGRRPGLCRRLMDISALDRAHCYFRFDLGGVVFFHDLFTSGHEQVGFAAITPADDMHTWFFGEHLRSFARNRAVDFLIRRWMRQLHGEDARQLEKLLSSRPARGLDEPVSVAADAPALAFRRIFFHALRRERPRAQPDGTPASPAHRIEAVT